MKFLLTIAVLFIAHLSFPQDIHSRWVNQPVSIDGDPSEWLQPFRYYDGNTKLQFSIANDSANIYVCFKVTDEHAQLRLFHAGIHVWFDPKGKRKETIGINFPLKQERSETHETEEGNHNQIPGQSLQKHDFARFKAGAMLAQHALNTFGFDGIPDQVLPLQNNHGINAAFSWDSLNILTIEYQIPIALTLKHNLTPADTTKTIGIGFVVGVAENGIRHTEGEHEGTGMESGNSGMRGTRNGMGGMNNGSSMQNTGISREGMHSNYNATVEEQKVWSKLRLAWQ